MSLYNALFGENPFANLLMELIGVNTQEFPVPRYRDCFLSEDGSEVRVRTRTGGGNRDGYLDENAALARHPLYIGDEDDDFDQTYATFRFRVPETLMEALAEIPKLGRSDDTASDRFLAYSEKVRSGNSDDPEVKRGLAVFEKIAKALKSGESKVIKV